MSTNADTIRDFLMADESERHVERVDALNALTYLEADHRAEVEQLRAALAEAEHDAAMWRGALDATAEAARMGEADDDLEMRG